MGARVFNNDFFDLWPGKETDRILNKIDKETITSDEMILLILKAQTNHFSHMDDDIKGGLSQLDRKFESGLSALDQKIEDISIKTDKRFEKIDQRFEKLEHKIEDNRIETNQRFERIDQKFEKIDQRFDSLRTEIRWGFGLCLGIFSTVFAKLIIFP
jgi:tetrahydromethanopterin S-methyltransferase subunit G